MGAVKTVTRSKRTAVNSKKSKPCSGNMRVRDSGNPLCVTLRATLVSLQSSLTTINQNATDAQTEYQIESIKLDGMILSGAPAAQIMQQTALVNQKLQVWNGFVAAAQSTMAQIAMISMQLLMLGC